MAYKGYLKKDAIRNYFPMPNAIFNLGLTTGELAVYAYLMFCENRKTYQCYPSFRTIGAAVDMSRPTVKKHVDGLVEKGLIYTEPTSIFTKAGKKQNGSLLYTIRPIKEAQQLHYEKQLLKFEEDAVQQKAAGDRR